MDEKNDRIGEVSSGRQTREGEKRETMLHKLVEQSFLKAVGSNEILMTFS